MNTIITYQIVEDSSAISNSTKHKRILITVHHYQLLMKTGLIKTKLGSAPYKVVGTVTKRQLQYHAAKIADNLRRLTKNIQDLPIIQGATLSIAALPVTGDNGSNAR